MQRARLVAAVRSVALATFLLSCSSRPPAPAEARPPRARPVVYASVYPLQYFAERIAGGRVEVRPVVPVGENAERYVPGAETVRALQKADLILINGASLEKWLGRVLLPASRVVETTKPLRGDLMVVDKTVTHSHGLRGAHTHEGVVAQTWLDPAHASVQAREVAEALSRLLPAHAGVFREHLAELEGDLRKLGAAFEQTFDGRATRRVLFSRPVYEYLVKRHGLNAAYLGLDAAEMPSDEAFDSIGRMLEARPARFVVWERPPSEEIAGRFREELGLESTFFETCTTLTREHAERGMDYFAIIERGLANLRAAFAAEE